jgi:hypothetical protein
MKAAAVRSAAAPLSRLVKLPPDMRGDNLSDKPSRVADYGIH